MDSQGPAPPPARPTHASGAGPTSSSRSSGGTVEPANRSSLIKDLLRGPAPTSDGPRYELKDPFAEVTYRSSTYKEITDKADRLGSTRITAITADGRKSRIEKDNGRWPAEPGHPERQSTPPGASKVVPFAREPAASPLTAHTAPAPTPPVPGGERQARLAAIESALAELYAIKRAPVRLGELHIGRTEYHFRGEPGRLAFTESTFKLATDSNSPSVARSMVDVAEARSWKALRVNGNEDFRRLVWMEASVRGIKAVGYEPTPADQALLVKERESRQVNRIEQVQAAGAGTASATATKGTGRGGGRKAVLAAIEAVLVDRKVPEAKREAILAASVEQLAQRAQSGRQTTVKVYDAAAPTQRAPAPTVPEPGRQRDRSAPTR